MKKKIVVYFIIVLAALYICIYIDAVKNHNNKNTYNSVVYIESYNDYQVTSGSGFTYKTNNGKNYILTAYHVIDSSDYIYIYNKQKKRAKANIVFIDEYNDIALLSIDDKLGLKDCKLGSSSKVNIGDEIYIIKTSIDSKDFIKVTKGSILSLDSIEDIFDYDSIELSVETEFGNSGGPLLNKNNEVIGMVFLKDKDSNKSYVIPIDYITYIINQVI